MMKRKAIWWGAVTVSAVYIASAAVARPNYLQTFKTHYKTGMGKPTLQAANCAMCHNGAPQTKMWNPYGQALRTALGATAVTDPAKIVAALQTAEKGQNATLKRTYASLIQADVLPNSQTAPGGGTGTAPVLGQWEALFNGTNLDGWTKMNAGDWVVQNGYLTYTGGGNGWLRSNKMYTNYSMVIVWRYPNPGDNDAGVFLKATAVGSPWPDGANWQLNMGPGQNFGSLGGTTGSRARGELIKANDWNVYQISVDRDMASLAINGTVAWDRAVGLPTRPGYIGIQNEGKVLQIAQVWIMPRP